MLLLVVVMTLEEVVPDIHVKRRHVDIAEVKDGWQKQRESQISEHLINGVMNVIKQYHQTITMRNAQVAMATENGRIK